jgi:hypothetical protein
MLAGLAVLAGLERKSFRIEIILAGFINDTNEVDLRRLGIGQDAIELPKLK